MVAEMLAVEREARVARRAKSVHREIGSFQLVEGTIRNVAERRKYTYLNFGENWRTDFTAAMRARARRSFESSGMSLSALKGRKKPSARLDQIAK